MRARRTRIALAAGAALVLALVGLVVWLGDTGPSEQSRGGVHLFVDGRHLFGDDARLKKEYFGVVALSGDCVGVTTDGSEGTKTRVVIWPRGTTFTKEPGSSIVIDGQVLSLGDEVAFGRYEGVGDLDRQGSCGDGDPWRIFDVERR